LSHPEEKVDDAVAQLMRDVAARDADSYLREYLLPRWRQVAGDEQEGWEIHLSRFAPALRLVLREYAFGHRRFARLGASVAAEEAIRWVERRGVREFLDERASEPFWKRFVDALPPRGKKSSDQLEGLMRGLLEWNFETYGTRGEEGLVAWVLAEIRETGRLEHVHQLLREIPGFGPKAASRLLRDLVLVFDLEEGVHPADRYLLQTVGGAIRKAAARILPGVGVRQAVPDWVMAGKISKACRLVGVSGARFNAGAEWHYGISTGQKSED